MRGAALLLLAAGGPALAGPTIEMDPKTEAFASRTACEQALERRRSAALSRLAALPAAQKRGTSVSELKRSVGEHLSYAEKVELGAGEPGSEMPESQTEQFTCRGSTLEHRIDFGSSNG